MTYLLSILEQDDISIDADHLSSMDIYTIQNSNEQKLFTFVNAWGYGRYTIEFNGNTIADIGYKKNKKRKPSDEQQIVLDIFNKIIEKDKILKSVPSLAMDEKLAWEFLQKSRYRKM